MSNSVILKNYLNIFVEMVAASAITPGHFVELTSNGKVQAHSAVDGNILPMVAVEDALQGKDADEAYATDDQTQVWVPARGDEVNAILQDSENISTGDFLQSNGDGTLKAFGSGTAVAVALEDVDLSGSSGEESSGGLGYNKRIKVRMV